MAYKAKVQNLTLPVSSTTVDINSGKVITEQQQPRKDNNAETYPLQQGSRKWLLRCTVWKIIYQ